MSSHSELNYRRPGKKYRNVKWRSARLVSLDDPHCRFSELFRNRQIQTIEPGEITSQRNVLVHHISAAFRQRVLRGRIEGFLPTIQYTVMAGLAHHLQRLRIWTLPTERIGLPSRIGARHPRAGLVVFYNDLRAAKRPATDDGNSWSLPAQGLHDIRSGSLLHPHCL